MADDDFVPLITVYKDLKKAKARLNYLCTIHSSDLSRVFDARTHAIVQ